MREAGPAISSVRSVLRDDWDPIGVSAESPDEYDSYAVRLYDVATRTRSLELLCAELARIEIAEMCLMPTQRLFNRRPEVSQKLLDCCFLDEQ